MWSNNIGGNTMRLREIRKKQGMTAQVLAEKLGVSQGAISHYETGRRKPSIDMVVKMAKVFNCSVDDLIRC